MSCNIMVFSWQFFLDLSTDITHRVVYCHVILWCSHGNTFESFLLSITPRVVQCHVILWCSHGNSS
jgi:hypothetical protein